jgi:glycosyltransferase involved in cell wall biosynthesis
MPEVNFYFAGDGPYFNLVKQNCPPNMLLIGRVSEPEVKKLLESGDIFVHPSGLDALPRIVKEASLMEKPIVASNVGGIVSSSITQIGVLLLISYNQLIYGFVIYNINSPCTKAAILHACKYSLTFFTQIKTRTR